MGYGYGMYVCMRKIWTIDNNFVDNIIRFTSFIAVWCKNVYSSAANIFMWIHTYRTRRFVWRRNIRVPNDILYKCILCQIIRCFISYIYRYNKTTNYIGRVSNINHCQLNFFFFSDIRHFYWTKFRVEIYVM